MWKGPTITMDTVYPFGAAPDHPGTPPHLIRKKIVKTETQLEKSRTQAHLKHDCLIKLLNAQEEAGNYYLLFEHVSTSLEKWHLTVSRQFVENYEQRMILFSRYLADRGIITVFNRDRMGVTETGEAKYFLDPGFTIEVGIDKLELKKKYKEQIREQIQMFIDRKVVAKPSAPGKALPEKKENTKILKILEAIEKGKAHMCPGPGKETALVPQQQSMKTTTLKPIKNMQNVIIQKQVSKVNKIQVMVNNKPMEIMQHEYKTEYASSSFYVNGVMTAVVEREGEARRLFSPNDKFARFEDVKYKEYKSLKTSGEFYVQDFINVLEADDRERPGSPRNTFTRAPKLSIVGSPNKNLPSERVPRSSHLAIEAEQLVSPTKMEPRRKQPVKDITPKRQYTPRQPKATRENLFMSDKVISKPVPSSPVMKSTSEYRGAMTACESRGAVANKTNDLQKKVSQAIANSLSAISKFKSAKQQAV